jgi:hypothetical protein
LPARAVEHIEPIGVDIARDMNFDGYAIASEASSESVGGFLPGIGSVVIGEDGQSGQAGRRLERLQTIFAERGPDPNTEQLAGR